MTHENLSPTQPLEDIGMQSVTGDPTIALDGEESAADLPDFNFDRPIKIADHICSNTRQLVLLVCDRSGSMSGAKIDELNLARFALLQELADPDNKDGFYLGVIEFCHVAQSVVEPQSVVELQLPDAMANGGTNFDAALGKATEMVTAFQSRPNAEGWHYLRPQVLFLSDGHSQVSVQQIRNLQEVANIWAIAYGHDADQKMLASIASDGQVHFVGIQGGELRRFLASVGKTLSEGMAGN